MIDSKGARHDGCTILSDGELMAEMVPEGLGAAAAVLDADDRCPSGSGIAGVGCIAGGAGDLGVLDRVRAGGAEAMAAADWLRVG